MASKKSAASPRVKPGPKPSASKKAHGLPPMSFAADDSQPERTFICQCAKCKDQIGLCYNRWEKLSRSYSTLAPSDLNALDAVEFNQDMQRATVGSELEGCLVQIVKCRSCGTALGLVCAEVPPSKQRYKDKLAFKLAKLEITSFPGHEIVEPVIIDPLEVNGPELSRPGPKAVNHHTKTTTAPLYERASIDEEEDEVPSIIQEQLDAQAQDIDRIMDLMDTFRNEVTQIRTILNDLRAEVRSRPPSHNTTSGTAMQQHVDLLSAEINRVGAKTRAVDELNVEVRFMKARLKQLEDGRTLTPMASTRSASLHMPPPRAAPTTTNPSHFDGPNNTASYPNHHISSGSLPGQSVAPYMTNTTTSHATPAPAPASQHRNSTSPKSPRPFRLSKTIKLVPQPSRGRKDSTLRTPVVHDTNTKSTINSMTQTNASGKRKRQPPLRPEGIVDWPTAETIAEVPSLPTSDDSDVIDPALRGEPRVSSKKPGTGSGNADKEMQMVPPASTERLPKRRKADVATRDLEVQRAMEREERE